VIKNYPDRGEVSDIIIWGKEHFLSIEVKYLSDWTYEKDIKEVQQRIIDLGKTTEKCGIQVLLVSEKKWKNNQSHQNQTGSNLASLIQNKESLKVPLIVITWEQLTEIISNQKVLDFIQAQLKREF